MMDRERIAAGKDQDPNLVETRPRSAAFYGSSLVESVEAVEYDCLRFEIIIMVMAVGRPLLSLS
jgi:hypothetical protein